MNKQSDQYHVACTSLSQPFIVLLACYQFCGVQGEDFRRPLETDRRRDEIGFISRQKLHHDVHDAWRRHCGGDHDTSVCICSVDDLKVHKRLEFYKVLAKQSESQESESDDGTRKSCNASLVP